ncbi:hypothetical protein E2C01_100449 [Portunus trituberculatus]|uniref:Uncharacterized protein n=1 Tax=Portunus trituberculatus TaxID=210409 RepID=A0A5B7KDD4_PORTR|nr:hypothetical protein [Portunus trituberculatus]
MKPKFRHEECDIPPVSPSNTLKIKCKIVHLVVSNKMPLQYYASSMSSAPFPSSSYTTPSPLIALQCCLHQHILIHSSAGHIPLGPTTPAHIAAQSSHPPCL